MIIILYLSVALIAVAFLVLVIYLSKTLKSLQLTLKNVASTLEGLEGQMKGITTETAELLHKTNRLAEDIQEKGRPSARHSDTGQRNGPAGNRDCVCQFEAQEEKTGYSEGAGGQQDDPVAHGENGAGTEEAMMPGYISIDRKSFGRYAYNIRKNQKNKVERWRHEDSTD